jgi:iron complex outermembrane receptor protein
MITRICFFAILLVFAVTAQAQVPAGNSQDTLVSAAMRDTVTVTAFNLHTKWKETPAAIAIINQQIVERFGQASLVPVFNTVAGVRMEERSPGSYRLSIRGSLLRSPFGIRNLKIYWDEIPLTDAGGNSYFNLVDFSQLQSAEIIKGPAASMYGANTGGAVLLHSIEMLPRTAGHSWELGMSGGAYGMFRQHAGYSYTDTAVNFQVRQLHQQSDGYRQQSHLRKDGVQVNSRLRLNQHQQLSVMAFYTDLYYQTPGGITPQQMEQDPKLARQKTATLPGAVEQQAAIYNKTVFGGLSLLTNMGDHWQNTTVVTLNHTDFKNPFITNYEKRNEWNYGGRTAFRYRQVNRSIQWNATAGMEWLQNKASVDNYGNRAGVIDTVQYKDRLRATQSFAFAQGDMRIGQWLIQAGVSRNLLTSLSKNHKCGLSRPGKRPGQCMGTPV